VLRRPTVDYIGPEIGTECAESDAEVISAFYRASLNGAIVIGYGLDECP
jgi:hypothetical protein